MDRPGRTHTPGLRIGELARRTGVAATTLRAWEARYGLVAPARTAGGQRLYREVDVARVRAVRDLVGAGWSLQAAVGHVVPPPDRRGGAADGPQGPPTVGSGRPEPAGAGRRFERHRLLDALAAVDAYAVLAAYEAARDMLRAAEAAAVRDAVVRLVRRLGGTVGEAAVQDDVVLPVDLSFGEGEPLLPRAVPGSLARMRLEAVLPLVVEDARVLVHRIGPGGRREPVGQPGRETPDHGDTG
jgi:hypothetical protein